MSDEKAIEALHRGNWKQFVPPQDLRVWFFFAHKVPQRLCSNAQCCRGHECYLAKNLGGHRRFGDSEIKRISTELDVDFDNFTKAALTQPLEEQEGLC